MNDDRVESLRAHADVAPLEFGAWVQQAAVLLTEASHEIKRLRALQAAPPPVAEKKA